MFAAKYLPFTDLPEHVAVVSSLMHWSDPVFRVREHYRIAFPESQYLLFHLCAAGVSTLVRDPLLGTRLVLAAVGIAYPFSLRSLLIALRGDQRLAVFAMLVFWNRALTIGFLPFVSAVPLVLWALALLVRQNDRAAAVPRFVLMLLAVATFYMHVACFLLLVGCAVALTVGLNGNRPFGRQIQALLRLWWLIPSFLCMLVWVRAVHLGIDPQPGSAAHEINYLSVGQTLAAFPSWSHDIWPSHLDELCAFVWWASYLLLATATLLNRRAKLHAMLLSMTPFACAVALYFAMPYQVGVGIMLNIRLAPVLALFALLPLRPAPLRMVTLARAAGAVAALAMSIAAIVEIRQAAQDELGNLEQLLARARPGASMLALNFDITLRHAHFAPWLYVASYHRVRTGAVTAYSFSLLPHWPVQFTGNDLPPVKSEAFWADYPCVFRNRIDGPYFDYVLVRGTAQPFANEPEGPRFSAVFATRAFTLYERVNGAHWPAGVAIDRGPCAKRVVPTPALGL